MSAIIFHIDCNKFFASVECLHRPEIRHLPVAVCGDSEKRHGIVLTANQTAAKMGVRSAQPLWRAKILCPDLKTVSPNYPLYVRFSNLCRKIYADYTDKVESFGLDECWLDVSDNVKDFDEAQRLAHKIKERIKFELGITVSVGVSWNKVFSKLASDYKKPDAVTVFSHDNYKDLIYPLPARDLLYVGPATERKLAHRGIFTIGDLAQSDENTLLLSLGKNGLMLKDFALGKENTPVRNIECEPSIKSVGNSVTAPRDLVTYEDVKLTFSVLCDTVARRLRDHALKGRRISISVRKRSLDTTTRQLILDMPTCSSKKLLSAAMTLFYENYSPPFEIRSVGVTAGALCSADRTVQFDMFGQVKKNEKEESLEKTVDILKDRFGSGCVKTASMLSDIKLTDFSPYEEHRVHPEGWFRL